MTKLTIPLDKEHNRKEFDCGKQSLNHYIQRQVSQDIKRRLCVCFVKIDDDSNVIGYYTLSNFSIPLTEVPEELRKKMPQSYQSLPTTLLGRLA